MSEMREVKIRNLSHETIINIQLAVRGPPSPPASVIPAVDQSPPASGRREEANNDGAGNLDDQSTRGEAEDARCRSNSGDDGVKAEDIRSSSGDVSGDYGRTAGDSGDDLGEDGGDLGGVSAENVVLLDASGGVVTGEDDGDPDSDVATSGAPVSDIGNRVEGPIDVEETVFRSTDIRLRDLEF